MSDTLSNKGAQLTLNLRPLKQYSLDNFDFSEAPNVKSLLSEWLLNPTQQLLIQGPEGSGKSHLLQAAANSAEAQGLSVGFLGAKEILSTGVIEVDNDGFNGYDCFTLLIIDDVDKLCAHSHWCYALFNLYNRHQDQGLGLLMSTSTTPRNIQSPFADMLSRLQMALMLNIGILSEQKRQEQLLIKAQHLGLNITPEVAHYVCLRAPRNMGSLMQVLYHLDAASWENKRKLTIPFIKEVMHW